MWALEVLVALQFISGSLLIMKIMAQPIGLSDMKVFAIMLAVQLAHVIVGVCLILQWNAARVIACVLLIAQVPWITFEEVRYISYTGACLWISLTDFPLAGLQFGVHFSIWRSFVPFNEGIGLMVNVLPLAWIAVVILQWRRSNALGT